MRTRPRRVSRSWCSPPAGGTSTAAEGLSAGVDDDYLTKAFATPELLARARANYELNQLRERAIDVADNRAAQLRSALDSNRIIGTATDILVAKHRLFAAQGFQLRTRASQDGNRKLRDLAVQVVEIGRLPLRQTAVDKTSSFGSPRQGGEISRLVQWSRFPPR